MLETATFMKRFSEKISEKKPDIIDDHYDKAESSGWISEKDFEFESGSQSQIRSGNSDDKKKTYSCS